MGSPLYRDEQQAYVKPVDMSTGSGSPSPTINRLPFKVLQTKGFIIFINSKVKGEYKT